MQDNFRLQPTSSSLLVSYSECQRRIDWRTLQLFGEDLGLCIRGDFICFLIVFLEEDQAKGLDDNNSPLEEHRAKSLLQGLIYSVLELLTDWRKKVADLPSGSPKPVTISQFDYFSEVIGFLERIVLFYESKRFAGLRNQGFRDNQGVLWVVAGENTLGELEHVSVRDITERLETAFAIV